MDSSELLEYLLTPMAQVAIVIGIAEVMKRIGFKPKYVPLLDLVIGLGLGLFVYGGILHYGLEKSALLGIVIGLSACGLFSGVKNVSEEIKEEV